MSIHVPDMTPSQREANEARKKRELRFRGNAKKDEPASIVPSAPPAPLVQAKLTRPSFTTFEAHESLGGSPLDARNTFEAFVVGRSNTVAHAAARQIAAQRNGDPISFNPLYVHASVGLGKTHLLQALAWAGNADGSRKVLYLTVEKLMFSFLAAIKTHSVLSFKQAIRGFDTLVIDDLQFLQGKSSQVEFGHTLNALIDGGRQVVVAADRSPVDLDALDDRLRSRLAGGVVLEIGHLDEDMRIEILSRRIRADQSQHPDFIVPNEVVEFLAKSIVQSGRDLEGAVNRLLIHWKLTGEPITLTFAEQKVRDLIKPLEVKRVRVEDIQRLVAAHFSVSRADMMSARRTAMVVRPRQVAMYLAKTLTLKSLPEIGRRFGGRDHTTVLHAVRKVESLLPRDEYLRGAVDVLTRRLTES